MWLCSLILSRVSCPLVTTNCKTRDSGDEIASHFHGHEHWATCMHSFYLGPAFPLPRFKFYTEQGRESSGTGLVWYWFKNLINQTIQKQFVPNRTRKISIQPNPPKTVDPNILELKQHFWVVYQKRALHNVLVNWNPNLSGSREG